MVTRKLTWLLVLIVSLLALSASVVEARGQWGQCSLATLEGKYGISIQATVVEQLPHFPAPPFPFVEAGTANYDGAGTVSVAYTLNINGTVVPGTGTGTYTVEPDCEYSDEIATSSGSVVHHVGNITGRFLLQQVNFVYTDAWLVGFGTFNRIQQTACSQATLKGTYSGTLQGTLVAAFPGFPPPPLAFAESTMHVYDGAGTVSGKATASVEGVKVLSTFTGTYDVKPDCSYTAKLKTSSGLVIHDVGTITGPNSLPVRGEIHEIWSVPGTVVSGTLSKRWP
jgi:hypothetical protein